MRQQEVNRLDVADEVVRADIEGHVQLLDKRIKALRQSIREHIDGVPDLRSQKDLLLSIPGIGEKTVAAILSYFAAIERFTSAKKLASFCGVAPREIQSGSSINCYGRMSKVGPAAMRKLIHLIYGVLKHRTPFDQEMGQKLLAS